MENNIFAPLHSIQAKKLKKKMIKLKIKGKKKIGEDI